MEDLFCNKLGIILTKENQSCKILISPGGSQAANFNPLQSPPVFQTLNLLCCKYQGFNCKTGSDLKCTSGGNIVSNCQLPNMLYNY